MRLANHLEYRLSPTDVKNPVAKSHDAKGDVSVARFAVKLIGLAIDPIRSGSAKDRKSGLISGSLMLKLTMLTAGLIFLRRCC